MGIGSGGGVGSSGEQVAFQILKEKANAPYCIFDIGANKGQFLRLILANMPAASSTIHCFEPGRETFRCLTEAFPDPMGIKLNQTAMGSHSGEAVLHYDIEGSGLASSTRRRLDHFAIDFNKAENVSVTTIDHYCAAHGISHIHLLKIDVEGHELDVLAGASGMFADRAIDVVTFEFGGCNIDTRTFFQDFWYFFQKVNFSLFRITPSGYLYPISSYNEINEQFRTTNFIAVANK